MKQKIGNGTYKVYGNRDFYNFVVKYDINVFYISYLPQSYVMNSKFVSVFYLEMDPVFITDGFYGELFGELGKLNDCGDERFEDVKKKYEAHLNCEIMKANIKDNIKNKEGREVDVDKKRKKRERKNRIMIKK